MKRIKLWLSYIGYARKGKFGWPSRLQRLFMQGDPTGEVARISAAVRGELYAELDNEPAPPEVHLAEGEFVTIVYPDGDTLLVGADGTIQNSQGWNLT